MSDDEEEAPVTPIICGRCGASVRRGIVNCTTCGGSLSSSQIKASQLREMTPQGFREVAERYVKLLEALPEKPVGAVARKALLERGGKFAIEFRDWERGTLPDVGERLERLTAFSTWCSLVASELRR